MLKVLVLLSLVTSMQLHAFGCFPKKEAPAPIKPPPAIVEEVEVVQVAPAVTLITATPFTFLSSAPTGGFPESVIYSPDGKFAAVTNKLSNTISVYSVNQHTGAFTEIKGSPFEAGLQPDIFAYSPNGRFASVTNTFGNSIFVYRVDRTSGALSLIQSLQPPFNPELNEPFGIVYSPDGRFVAVTNPGGGNISIYQVHPITGKLSLVGTPLNFGTDLPAIIKYSPDGRFAAVTFNSTSNGATFTVDPSTGALSNQMNFLTDFEPFGIAYSPNGNFAAVCNFGPSTITTYTVNQTSGTFTKSGTNDLSTLGVVPLFVEYSPDGKLAAVTCNEKTNPGVVVLFCVDQTTGLFTQITPPITNLQNPNGLAFHPCKDFAAVTDLNENIVAVYGVDTSVCP